ncbi:MAG: GGDEF domain-containing protein [Rhizobiaceae bacterium]
MAAAFHIAGRERKEEPYWISWFAAHALLAVALFLFMFEPRLPSLLAALLPNGLLVIGFGLRWQAARQFSGRHAHPAVVWGPAAIFMALSLLPPALGPFGWVFMLTNSLLAVLATLTAWEFWRDRHDGYLSRRGLTLAYLLIAASFGIRAGQGLLEGGQMEQYLPLDAMLTLHLFVALVHVAMAGAFAITLAFERNAETLRRFAMMDGLTGLLNRGAFEALLREAVGDSRRHRFALAILDIDHFKAVNDNFGHGAGDAAIRASAEALTRAVRTGDIVARIGGEEFAVVLWDVSQTQAGEVVEDLRRAIEAIELRYEGHLLRLTASAGYCHVQEGAGDFDRTMRAADAALYKAKREGRNRIARAA